jgi:hypothetical protein
VITTQHIQEDLSRAYVQAVAGMAGLLVSINGRSHDYGVDGTFHQVTLLKSRRVESGFNLDFQCKASIDWTRESTEVVYDLESQTYNDLIFRSRKTGATPLILILLCLPADQSVWLHFDETRMLLKECSYWHQLTGQETDNKNSRRIRIPRTQMLDPKALGELLERVEQGSLR